MNRQLTTMQRSVIQRMFTRNSSSSSSTHGTPNPSLWDQSSFENYRASKLGEVDHAATSGNRWKQYFWFLAIPSVLGAMFLAYRDHQVLHHKPRAEFIEYPHLRIRRREYPWGGNKSLFHNPETNPLPVVGYEAPDPSAGHGHH